MNQPLTQQDITVKSVGKFGLQNEQGVWYSVDGEGFTKDSFAPGQAYKVGVRYSSGGKPYIKEVISGQLLNGTGGIGGNSFVPSQTSGYIAPAPKPFVKTERTTTALPSAPVVEDKMSKADWARKDVVIARQAVIKSVLESQGVANLAMGLDTGAYLNLVKELAGELEVWVGRA